MNEKLKKDFAERQKIKEEAKLLGKDSFDIDESSKRKHGDDYRGKIIHDKDRFQDKIHEKVCFGSLVAFVDLIVRYICHANHKDYFVYW